MKRASSDIAIIGGGIIGLMTAWECAARGCQVTIIERDQVGQAASWAGGGILSPLCPWQTPVELYPLIQDSQQRYAQIAAELQSETGIDVGYRRSGLLHLAPELTEAELNFQQQFGLDWQYLSAAELQLIEPNLAPQVMPGILFPQVAQIRNPHLLQALKIFLQHHPLIKIYEHQEVINFTIHEQKILCANTQSTQFVAEKFVIAGGAWSGKLLDKLQLSDKIIPAFGQMLLLQHRPAVINHIVLQGENYLIPRDGGLYLVGSTVEYRGFSAQITDQARQSLLQFAQSISPEFKAAKFIDQWGGLRAYRGSQYPAIGKIVSYNNLYINSGHFRCGLTLAPASAKLLVNNLLGTQTLGAELNFLNYDIKELV